MMVVKFEYDGTLVWYRTDSYWDKNSYVASSTWGPSLDFSFHPLSTTDNSGTDNIGKHYVFALSDGSGVQLNHVTYNVVAPTTNLVAGTGTNALTTAPLLYYNTYPNLYTSNLCHDSNLQLAGIEDVTILSPEIQDVSDGYMATITLSLEHILAGESYRWFGVCMVMYRTQYVQTQGYGSVCVFATTPNTTSAKPTDFGYNYLVHLPNSIWKPPAMSAYVVPATYKLTANQYGVVHSPSSLTDYIYTQGYYSSTSWYQPFYASSYTTIARYGKKDYVGSYCAQGAGGTTYFAAPSASVQLTGAASLVMMTASGLLLLSLS